MVIPIYDNDPLDRNPYAFVTWTFIAINIVVFLIQLGGSDDTNYAMIRDFALIPAAITGKLELGGSLPPILSAFTYMFLHGGWSHIIGNMLFLWVLGDNIEDAFGSVRFFFFYMLCGAAGGLAHLAMHSDSATPLVGASGAVSGVVAAYLMLRPCAKIMVLLFGFVPLAIGSAWVLGFWALMQVWNVMSAQGGDTAWWAHVGGLLVGAGLTLVFRRPDVTLFECIRPGDAIAARQVLSGVSRRWGSR
jgi:membrane associated rhomboid family serine protease